MRTRWTSYFLSIGAIALTYWFIGSQVISTPVFSDISSPVWPSAGIAMAGLVILGCSRWPGVFLGAFLIDYDHTSSLTYAVLGAAGATLQAAAGAWLFQRLKLDRSLRRLQDAIGFVGVAVVITATISATISIGTLSVLGQLGETSVLKAWATFYLGDGTGILTVAPILMLLSQPHKRDRDQPFPFFTLIEGALWLLIMVVSSWLVFHQELSPSLRQYPLEYLPAPLLIWATLRFGQLAAVTGSVVITAIAISGFIQGGGLFLDRVEAANLDTVTAIWLLQTFMAVLGITTLVMATAVREQRMMQALLKKRDARLRNAQQIAQLGHWEFDLHTQQWTTSRELKQLLGISDGKETAPLSQETIRNQIVESDRQRVEHAYQCAVTTHQPYSVSYRITRPDGTLRHVIEQVAIRDACMMGVIQDVTDRIHAEQALRDSEEKFSKAFGFSPDAMTISTLDEGLLLEVNDSFLRMSGYQHHEVIQHTVSDLGLWLHPADREWLTTQLQHQKSVRNKEFGFRAKSGNIIFALISAEIITIQSEQYLLIVARDITEQKSADEQLQRTAERDRLLGNLALHIRQTLDLNQILNRTVYEVRQFLGTSRVFIGRFDESGFGEVVAEAVRSEFPSLLGETMDQSVHHEVARVFENMPVVAIDDMKHLTTRFPCLSFLKECVERYQVRASLGVPILVNDSLYGIMVAHSCEAPRHWTSFEKELLEQLAIQVAIAIQQGELYAQVQQLNTGLEHQVRERTQQLEDNMHELKELNQLKDVLLHAVSHDLLNTVKGNLMILGTLHNQPHDPIHIQRHCLERMISAGERQLNKLNALQEAYTFKTRGIHLDQSEIDPCRLMQAAIDDLTQLIGENQATVTMNQSCKEAIVSADRFLLLRVFKHLLSNAVIHNPPHTNIHVQLYTDQQNWVCSVSDDGIGVPEKMRDRLFQLCLGTTQNPQLTGISLGLYFCHQVIQAHNGHISISSVPDQGTGVTVVLPLSLHQPPPRVTQEIAIRS